MELIRTIKSRKTEIVVLLVLVFELSFPHFAVAVEPENSLIKPDFTIKAAQAADQESGKISSMKLIKVDIPQTETKTGVEQDNGLNKPEIVVSEYKVIKTYENVPITAYSSTVDQTDSDPCSTANGYNVCEHNQEDVIAANFLKFGTKVRIPEQFGNRIFTVQDRMNARYYYRADVWLKTHDAAVKFGIVYTKIEVIE
ncbi:MAG: hypothetical protein WC508_01545 [Patescibacteria group bacterium]